MLNKEEIEKALDQNEDIITYKADKDFRGLTSSERTLLENNKKIKKYIDQLEQENKTLKHTNKSYKGIINKQNKIIDEMAEWLIGFTFSDEKELEGIFCNTEEVKQYFEKKVEGK